MLAWQIKTKSESRYHLAISKLVISRAALMLDGAVSIRHRTAIITWMDVVFLFFDVIWLFMGIWVISSKLNKFLNNNGWRKKNAGEGKIIYFYHKRGRLR